jgi:cytochrome c-type biogenesis protein CcsB
MEGLFFWGAVALYAISTIAVVAAIAFAHEGIERWGYRMTVAAFSLHSLSILARWLESGRLPYVLEYENIVGGTWVVAALYLAITWNRRALRLSGLGVLPFVLISLGYALTLPDAITPVTAAYKSAWLAIHVLFAWATYAAYTCCTALAIVELLKSRRGYAPGGSLLDRTPPLPQLQDLQLRLVGFGFVVNGVMIASGAIWAYDLWGAYWRWDPVETWSLLTWLAYAFYLHARLTLGWRGKRLAWVAVFALLGVLMSFWGVQLLPGSYHLFRSLGGDSIPVRRF